MSKVFGNNPVKQVNQRFFKIILIILFVMYLSCLFFLTFFSRIYGRGYFHRSMNLIPFKTIHQYMTANYNSNIVMNNLLGNIAAFVPMGFLLPLVRNKSAGLLRTLLFAAGVSLMIEITQYIFGVGSTDIDDLFLNLDGGLLGYAFYKLAGMFYKKLTRLSR